MIGTAHPDRANILNTLASVANTQGRYGDAEALYTEALELRSGMVVEDDSQFFGSFVGRPELNC